MTQPDTTPPTAETVFTAPQSRRRNSNRKCNVELMAELYSAGMPVDEIAPRVGLDRGASVSSWAKRLGLPLRNVRGVNDARDSAIYAAAKAGASREDLAELHGVSPSTIRKTVQRLAREENGPQRPSRAKPPVITWTVKPKVQRGPLSCSPAAIKRAMQARGIRP